MTFIPADEDDFYPRVAEALTGCQLVEQELKLYITAALEVVRTSLNGQVPFKITGADYKNKSLGRLIEAFRKLSTNAELCKQLEHFKGERNFLSHEAITHCMDPSRRLSLPEVTALEPRLAAIASEAQKLQHAIRAESNKFRVKPMAVGGEHVG
jgi:hypothetical protein